MTTNYAGVDLFSSNLDLVTDADQPRAQVFRVPTERLLDNDVHIRNRTVALETRATALEGNSNVTGLVTTTGATIVYLASKTLAANEAVAGTRYRFFSQIQVARGATASATDVSLSVEVGSDTVFIAGTINTTNGYTGTMRLEGEISFHSAPGAAAAYTVAAVGHSTVASATVVTFLPTPVLTLTEPTNAPLVIALRAYLNTATPGVSFTPVSAQIYRMKP